MKRFAAIFLLIAGLHGAAWAEKQATSDTAQAVDTDTDVDAGTMIEGVDIPTADILDAGTYSTAFRFYSGGGVTSRILLGPLKRLNLGVSFDVQRLIGSGTPHMVTPALHVKIRAFDGTDILPALALGYDGQGMLYQDSTRRFLNKRRGLYLVGSHEFLLPDLELHAGVNFSDVDDAKAYGFVGSTYRITNAFAFLVEYDNIRNGPENRVNIGGRYWIIPSFSVDLAARNVGRNGDRGGERILRLNYVGNFPF